MTVDWSDPALAVAMDDGVRFRTIEDEVVVYNPRTDDVSHLDAIGSIVWHHIADPVRIGELLDRLREHFEVDPEVLAADVAQLLAALNDKGLIQTR